MILKDILQTIGDTPIIKLNKIGNDLPCEFYVKCEYKTSASNSTFKRRFNI